MKTTTTVYALAFWEIGQIYGRRASTATIPKGALKIESRFELAEIK